MHSHEPQQEGRPQDRSSAPARHGRTKWVFVGFLALAAGLLVAEHRGHVLGALPWLILLACPLMHLFMHRGHAHGSHDHHNANQATAADAAARRLKPTHSEPPDGRQE